MSRESLALGHGNETLSVEKIQNGIKDFFARRGMLGDDVKGCCTGQNMTYGLKDKDQDAKVNNIIKSIVEKSTLDLANLRQLIAAWDREERATSRSLIDESSYGTLTQQKIKRHLKDYFSQRIVVADQEEGACDGDRSALRIFARPEAPDPDILSREEADDVSEEELSVNAEAQTSQPDEDRQRLDGAISPASSASLLEKAKDLISQVLNPVVDSIGKTIVEKVKSTLEKTVRPVNVCGEKQCTSRRESSESSPLASEGNLTPERYTLSSMSDSKAEIPSRLDFSDREATAADTRPSTGLLEEAAQLGEMETDRQGDPVSLEAFSVPSRPENTPTPCDDPTRISSESLERASTASNLVHDIVDVLCLPDSPPRTSSTCPPSEEPMALSDTDAPSDRGAPSKALDPDLPLSDDGREERSSFRELDDEITKRPFSEAVETYSELPVDSIATGLSLETLDTDLELPEDLVEKGPWSEKTEVEPTMSEDQVAERPLSDSTRRGERAVKMSSPEAGSVKSPEGRVSKRPSAESATDAAGPSERVGPDPGWREDRRVQSSLGIVWSSPLPLRLLATKRPSSELQWPVATSLEFVDADHWELEASVSARSSEATDEVEAAAADDSPRSEDRAREPPLKLEVDGALEGLYVISPSVEAVDRQSFRDPEAKRPLSDAVEDASLLCFVVKKPSVEAGDDAESLEGSVSRISFDQTAVERDTPFAEEDFDPVSAWVKAKLSEDGLSRTSSSPEDVGLVPKLSESRLSRRTSSKAADVYELSEDRISYKSLSPVEEGVVSTVSESRLSRRASSKVADMCKLSEAVSSEDVVPRFSEGGRSRGSCKTADVGKWSEERITPKSSSSEEAGLFAKLPESRLSGRASSKLDVQKLLEDRISRKSSAELGLSPKWSEGRLSRSSSKTSPADVRNLSEGRISRRPSSKDAIRAISRLSQDRISRRSSSSEALDANSRYSQNRTSGRCSSREAAGVLCKLSGERISGRSSSKAPGDKASRDGRSSAEDVKRSSEETTEADKLQVGTGSTVGRNRLKWRRKGIVPSLLEDCPGSVLECIRTKPALRPICKKLTSMWKTRHGRRKHKRAKTKGQRKSLRSGLLLIFKERPATSVASPVKLLELLPSDSEGEPSQSAPSVENAHDIHSFFENMFKKEFSTRLEKSLKRGLLNVVNDYNERVSRSDKSKPK